MTPGNAPDDEPTVFSAVLRPNRSLGRNGFFVLMALFGGVSFVAGVAFAMMGAWPVFGFFGLDVVLMYWAFRVNYRDGRAFEVVTITPSAVTVRQVSHCGVVQEWSLNPLWVRLDREAIEDFGTQKLFLVSHGKKFAVANVLGPFEKESFAQALAAGLAAARRGPIRTPAD